MAGFLDRQSGCYRLKKEAVLVRGRARSAIYDLSGRKVYSINRNAERVLERAFRGRLKKKDKEFIATLQRLNLIEACDIAGRAPEEPEIPSNVDARLAFVWLEVTSRCNLSCLHCYGDCLSQPSQGADMGQESWQEILDQVSELGCDSIQFIGGEPFVYKRLKGLVEYASSLGFSYIEIFSNLTLLDDGDIRWARERGLQVATTLYSIRPETHDRITRRPGSHEKTLKAIFRLREAGVPVRVAIIAMRQNQQDLEETVAYLKEKDVPFKMPDPVRPSGRGCSRELVPKALPRQFSGLMDRPDFSTDQQTFHFNRMFNSCWAGKVAVTSTGTVIPCIFAREQVVGNLLKDELRSILEGERLRSLWRLTKDRIEVCRECEYRYACHDCRPLALGITGNLLAKSPRCMYDPRIGRWK